MIPLGAYLAVAAALFLVGLVMVASRRNLVYVLMGLELILNAANLNLVAFDRFRPGAGVDGQITALFVIILAAAEAAIALAIVLNAFSLFETIRPDEMDTMKD
ncbi:MAG: NADH-quinone oxidoreductase subunit NuoK [Planctomycetota bacterium]|nr:MAG: NADH-quinone oxidoreductase subunit NuoK [Planctomycetota bacterium]